jgi:replicative DNA helicase
MQKYIEFREGLVDNRGERANIIRLEDLPQAINPLKDAYRSLFYYDDSILKHVTDNGSVSGFRGKVGIDRVAFDMDNTDLEAARQDTLELVNRLVSRYDVKESEIGVFFSGRKGFSVEIKTEGLDELGEGFNENIPVIVKKLAIKVAGDLESFDRVIYNHNRLYRLAGTLHQKESTVDDVEVKLFKTAVPFQMLRDSAVEDIQRYCVAVQPMITFDAVANPEKLNAELKNIVENLDKITRELPTVRANSEGMPDDSLAPKGYKVCLWRLAQGSFTESRDNALLRIADHERKLGFPAEVIKGKLLGVVDVMNQHNPEKAKVDPISEDDIERIIRQTFNNKYDFGCNDEILAKVCSQKCYLAPAVFKEEASSMGSPLEAYKRYANFARSYFANMVPTGLKAIDGDMPFLVGTCNLIIGKPGTGKTSLMLNILHNANKIGMATAFFSVDMSEEMIIQKAAPILIKNSDGTPKYTAREVTELHARGDKKIEQEAEEAFHNLSKNVLISTKASMTVDEIADEIRRQEEKTGRKIKLAIVDYVQLLKSPYESGSHTSGNFNATRLREVAKEMNVCFILLSQTSRSNGGNEGDAPIGMNSAKGSGAWEEQAHNVLTCWRPFSIKNPKYDFVMTVRLAKNRLGQCKNADLYFHGPSGITRDLEEGEEILLTGLRAELEHDSK